MRALIIEAIRPHNVGLVVIDHMRYFDMDRRYQRVEEEDEAKAKFLKQDIATQLNVAVMVLAHTTKAIEQREDCRPRLSDLRGGGIVADPRGLCRVRLSPVQPRAPRRDRRRRRESAPTPS